jgi:broad specificity phosphatase PhoE
MPRIILVRHAKPAASWGQDADPGLDPLGATQAAATAEQIVAAYSPCTLYTSPLRRCRETAVPLERAWGVSAQPMAAAAEIPAPPLALGERHEWLANAMRGTWQQLQAGAPTGSPDYLDWRQSVLKKLAALQHDCVLFTHFVAINVVVGAARHSEAVVCFRPDHASMTVVRSDNEGWTIEQLGREAETTVLTR